MSKHPMKEAVLAVKAPAAQKQDAGAEKPAGEMPAEDFHVSTTHHQGEFNGKSFTYTARAGMMKMEDEKGNEIASIFFISYEKDQSDEEKAARPITFAFNGGPGAPSIWVHFGAMGPKRIDMTPDGNFLPPPYRFNDNTYSWLGFTDLVFIDPVGTGFSGHPDSVDFSQFCGIKEDVRSIGDFIRLYVTRHGRWLSPKFIAGESYGTTRAAGLAGHLQQEIGIDLCGIILISSVIDFSTTRYHPGNDLPYALFVPSFAATAWFHNRLSPRLQKDLLKTLEEVEDWVLEEFLPALARGKDLSGPALEKTAARLSQYTGLSKTFVKRCHLRISAHRFQKELLRDESRTVGRLDTRFKGIDLDSAGEHPEYDPSLLTGSFVTAASDFIRRQLKYENDRPYRFGNSEALKNWKWKENNDVKYPEVAESLRSAIHRNRHLRVLVMCGYFDIGTPYFAMKHTIGHMGLDPALRDNVQMAYYVAGHMVYYPLDMLKKFTADARGFIQGASSQHVVDKSGSL